MKGGDNIATQWCIVAVAVSLFITIPKSFAYEGITSQPGNNIQVAPKHITNMLSSSTQQNLMVNQTLNGTSVTNDSVTHNTGISLEEDRLIPPISPSKLSAHTFERFIELRWLGTGSDIAINYKVHRRLIGVRDWEVITTIPVQNDNKGEYIFHDSNIEGTLIYEYAVTIVDRYGNESSYSKIIRVKVNH